MKYRIDFGFGVSEDRDGNTITIIRREEAMDEIKRVCMSLFGGYTLTRTEGGWRNPQGRLVEEPGYTLSVLAKSDTRYFDEDPIKSMAGCIKQQLAQEAVAATVIECNWEML